MGWNTWCTDDACGAIDICSEKEVQSVATAIVSQGLDKLEFGEWNNLANLGMLTVRVGAAIDALEMAMTEFHHIRKTLARCQDSRRNLELRLPKNIENMQKQAACVVACLNSMKAHLENGNVEEGHHELQYAIVKGEEMKNDWEEFKDEFMKVLNVLNDTSYVTADEIAKLASRAESLTWFSYQLEKCTSVIWTFAMSSVILSYGHTLTYARSLPWKTLIGGVLISCSPLVGAKLCRVGAKRNEVVLEQFETCYKDITSEKKQIVRFLLDLNDINAHLMDLMWLKRIEVQVINGRNPSILRASTASINGNVDTILRALSGLSLCAVHWRNTS